MATYEELLGLMDLSTVGAPELRDLVGIAMIVSSDIIMSGGDTGAPFDQTAGAHDSRVLWAIDTLQGTESRAHIAPMYASVLASNRAASVAAILGASDTAIQANVDAAVDAFATALTPAVP